jgi:DNA-binding NtrC family response regulator/tetratricopeptide (TPR) repeat protein
MDPLAEVLGESPAIETVRAQVRRLLTRPQGGRRVPAVLIEGETGSGKGLIARILHRAGPRARGPFVDVNCAAIPETLLEAELFGFERGAFTDARQAKPGLFQTAHHGTIFLDEIGLLPDALQAKLLKAIDEGAVRRLGSTRSEPTDVWIISATNADLATAVRERRFREDLYHRLAVLTVTLPPLRERGRDVVLLAERFLARACEDYGLPPRTLDIDAEERLLAYSWPGNIRELSNVIERVALLADSAVVTGDLLGLPEGTGPRGLEAARSSAGTPAPVGTGSLDEAMGGHVRAVLEETGWNISRAAARLGISRNTLRARIDRFGLRREAGAPPVREAPRPAPTRHPAPATYPAAPEAPVSAAHLPEPSTLRWERRRVTILRAELEVAPDTEELSDASRAIEALVEKVVSFGGRVEELGRVGIDASFGLDPVEDAPRRAANAALAIQKAGERARERDPQQAAVRLALDTSLYLVGQVAGAPQIDQAAKRRTSVFLDALIAAAEGGSIVLSSTTVPYLERRFELVPAGAVAGVTGQAYRLVGRDASGLGLWGRMGKFVGRRHELDLLRGRWALAARGRGQLVGLVGEPGVGKSRLLWEFTHAEAAQDWLSLEAAGISMGTATPYLTVVELLRDYFRVEAGDDAHVIEDKVIAKITALDEALVPVAPALLALLDVPVADRQWQAMNSAERRHRTLEAIKLLLVRESRVQPLRVVVEDAHWIDGETQAVLDALVEGLPTSRILLLLTYRPEYEHPWGNRTFYTQLRVDPLPPENAEELLDGLLGTHPDVVPLKPLLIDWTDGNPFFLEESVRTLVETQALAGERGAYRLVQPVPSIQVPATVEEVLAARIDRLPADEKRLLQPAAVIGRYVPVRLLAAVAEVPEETLARELAHLQTAEFLYETSQFPEPEFTFKHALTQEVAYASVLPDRRRALHARVLASIESLYADRLAEQVDRLAYHAFRGQVWDKALTYLQQAGDKAFARSANRETVTFLDQALAALDHLPRTRETQALSVDLRFVLRNALQPLGEFDSQLQRLEEAEAIATTLGDERRLAWVSAYKTDFYRLTGDQERAVEAGERAHALAQRLDDFVLKIGTNTWLGQVRYGLADYRGAIELFRQNVERLVGPYLTERFGRPQVLSIHSRTILVWCLAELGEFDEGIARGEEAMAIAEGIEQPLSLATAAAGLGYVLMRKGDMERAIPLLERGLEATRAGNSPLWFPRIASALGYAQALSGRIADGVLHLEQAVERSAAMKVIGAHALLLASLGEGYLRAGRVEEARRIADDALALAREHRERGHEAWSLRLAAEIALAASPSDPAAAGEKAQAALALAEAHGMRPLAAQCRALLARLPGGGTD